MFFQFLLDFIIESLPGAIIGILLSGFLFAIFETNTPANKEFSQKRLLISQMPMIALVCLMFYIEFTGFSWTNITTQSVVAHLLQINLSLLLPLMLVLGPCLVYTSFLFYRTKAKSVFRLHFLASIFLFYISYCLIV